MGISVLFAYIVINIVIANWKSKILFKISLPVISLSKPQLFFFFLVSLSYMQPFDSFWDKYKSMEWNLLLIQSQVLPLSFTSSLPHSFLLFYLSFWYLLVDSFNHIFDPGYYSATKDKFPKIKDLFFAPQCCFNVFLNVETYMCITFQTFSDICISMMWVCVCVCVWYASEIWVENYSFPLVCFQMNAWDFFSVVSML